MKQIGRYVNFELDVSENNLTETYSKYFELFEAQFKKRVEYFELDKLNAAVLFYIAQSKLFEKYAESEEYQSGLEDCDDEKERLDFSKEHFNSSDLEVFYFKNKEYLFLNVLKKAKFFLKHGKEDFKTQHKNKSFSDYFIDICENLVIDNEAPDIFSSLFKKTIDKIDTIIAEILIFYGELKYEGEKIYESNKFFELRFAKLILYFSYQLNKGSKQGIYFSNKIMVKFVAELMSPINVVNKKKVYAPITDYGSFFVYFLEELFKNTKDYRQIKKSSGCSSIKNEIY